MSVTYELCIHQISSTVRQEGILRHVRIQELYHSHIIHVIITLVISSLLRDESKLPTQEWEKYYKNIF